METKTNIVWTMMALVIMLIAAGCQPKNPDSKEIGEEQNEGKFENTSLENDSEFAVAAAEGSMLEVQLGQLAIQKATSDVVKQFAQQMITDHSKASEELMALASSKNITLPTSLSEKNQKRYDDLAGKSGEDFDDAYIEFMVKDHKDDIDKFKKEADKGEDAELKSWASGKISTLEHHLQMAEDAEDVVDKIQ